MRVDEDFSSSMPTYFDSDSNANSSYKLENRWLDSLHSKQMISSIVFRSSATTSDSLGGFLRYFNVFASKAEGKGRESHKKTHENAICKVNRSWHGWQSLQLIPERIQSKTKQRRFHVPSAIMPWKTLKYFFNSFHIFFRRLKHSFYDWNDILQQACLKFPLAIKKIRTKTGERQLETLKNIN